MGNVPAVIITVSLSIIRQETYININLIYWYEVTLPNVSLCL